jgi:hypothetical protein
VTEKRQRALILEITYPQTHCTTACAGTLVEIRPRHSSVANRPHEHCVRWEILRRCSSFTDGCHGHAAYPLRVVVALCGNGIAQSAVASLTQRDTGGSLSTRGAAIRRRVVAKESGLWTEGTVSLAARMKPRLYHSWGPARSGRSAPSELSRGRKANPLDGKLGAIMPEINTLPPKPRTVGHWAWMIMMVLALLTAIGRAVFG